MADTDGGALAVVDFVGSESSFAFANQVVRRGGRIIIVGLFGGGMSMPLPMFPMRAHHHQWLAMSARSATPRR